MTRLLLVAAVALVAVLAAAGPVSGAGAEWHVYPGADTPIQTAIDGAGEGDTIYVHAGTYIENVDVDKRITLIGDGADVVTVRAAGWGHVFDVTASWVNISGFAVTGATYARTAGIYLGAGTDHCNISDNNISNNEHGIILCFSSNNMLVNNTVNSGNYGICLLFSSNNNMLENNTVSNNWYGIVIYSASDNNKLNDNKVSDNTYGIFIGSSSNNTLVNTTANSNNRHGIWLSGSSGNTLIGNNASNNDCGILLEHSSNNTLTSNAVLNNVLGIRLYDSSGNRIYNNCFNNTANAQDTGTNYWDSGYAGNYYSGYAGTDNNTNNIGDTPYPIPGGESVDRYPLMQPWTDVPQRLGDLNRDGDVTPADAVITLRLAATGAHNPAADVSGDDRITALDALMILQAAAGRIEL